MHEKAINVHKKGNGFQKMNQGTLLQEQKFKRDQCVKCALAAQQSFSGLKNRLILRKLAKKKKELLLALEQKIITRAQCDISPARCVPTRYDD